MFLGITFVCSFGYMPFSPMFIQKYETLEEDKNGTEAKEEVIEIESGFEFRASLLKNKAYLLFCACRFFAIFAYYVPLFHLVSVLFFYGEVEHASRIYDVIFSQTTAQVWAKKNCKIDL